MCALAIFPKQHFVIRFPQQCFFVLRPYCQFLPELFLCQPPQGTWLSSSSNTWLDWPRCKALTFQLDFPKRSRLRANHDLCLSFCSERSLRNASTSPPALDTSGRLTCTVFWRYRLPLTPRKNYSGHRDSGCAMGPFGVYQTVCFYVYTNRVESGFLNLCHWCIRKRGFFVYTNGVDFNSVFSTDFEPQGTISRPR